MLSTSLQQPRVPIFAFGGLPLRTHRPLFEARRHRPAKSARRVPGPPNANMTVEGARKSSQEVTSPGQARLSLSFPASKTSFPCL